MKKCYATIHVVLHDMEHNIDLNYCRKIRPLCGPSIMKQWKVRVYSIDTWTRLGWWRESKNVCYCPCSGYENCPRRGGSKNDKILSLNDPLCTGNLQGLVFGRVLLKTKLKKNIL